MESIASRLTGGHPNSLGNTVAVVEEVLEHPKMFEELFSCYFSKDEVVRLRVSNAMKRIAKANKAMLLPYIDRLLTDVAAIDQASTQWTLAQLFLLLENDLTAQQRQRAQAIMQRNLTHHTDWIVLAQTMETLGQWGIKDENLKSWLLGKLPDLTHDPRKAVAKKADKWLQTLAK